MIEINLNGALPQAGTAGLRQTLLVASWSEQWYYWKSLCIFSIYLRVMSVRPPPPLTCMLHLSGAAKTNSPAEGFHLRSEHSINSINLLGLIWSVK